MIYILSGTDRKKKNAYVVSLLGDREVISFTPATLSKEVLEQYANTTTLFGTAPAVVVETALKESKSLFSATLLSLLQNSQTVFIFLEDKLLSADEKKYAKYATIALFEEKKAITAAPKVNTFAIADAYGRRDKVGTWVLYCQAIDKGTEPEAICGMVFWKIKTLIQNGTKMFTIADLKKQSGTLVSLYHKAHRGECDFTVGLEQFILSSLSTTAVN
jgi:hypothetical protein